MKMLKHMLKSKKARSVGDIIKQGGREEDLGMPRLPVKCVVENVVAEITRPALAVKVTVFVVRAIGMHRAHRRQLVSRRRHGWQSCRWYCDRGGLCCCSSALRDGARPDNHQRGERRGVKSMSMSGR